MTEPESKRIDLVVHEINYSGLPNFGVMLANALLDVNIKARLLVIGEEKEIPFPMHKDLEVKFFNIKRSKNPVGKALYLIRIFFILSTYFAKERTRNVFMLGKEFIAIGVLIKFLSPLKFTLGGFNDSNISMHIKYNTPAFLRYVLRKFFKITLKDTDYIISQSEGMTEDLSKIYEISKEKIATIPPIINKKFFAPAQNKSKTGKILFVGKLIDYKDPFVALKIFSELNNQQYTLEFVGEGELQILLEKKSIEIGLENRVKFAGRQNDITPYLNNADVVILTSKYEGLPMVLVEAIACGVPVVSFDCKTGPSEIIVDSVNGYLIPEGDIGLFIKKLDQALTRDWDHKKIVETANKFHPNVVIKRYIEVIRKHLA